MIVTMTQQLWQPSTRIMRCLLNNLPLDLRQPNISYNQFWQ